MINGTCRAVRDAADNMPSGQNAEQRVQQASKQNVKPAAGKAASQAEPAAKELTDKQARHSDLLCCSQRKFESLAAVIVILIGRVSRLSEPCLPAHSCRGPLAWLVVPRLPECQHDSVYIQLALLRMICDPTSQFRFVQSKTGIWGGATQACKAYNLSAQIPHPEILCR